MDLDFKQKVVIVTGASSGIGAATAKAFASYGAYLVLVGRNEARLTAVARECKKKNKEEQLCLLLDLRHEGSCAAVINRTKEHYGKINILINCAGTMRESSLLDKDIEAFDEMMLINVRVPYLLSKLALPHLIETKGCIVNLGSSMMRSHGLHILPFLLSKAAVKSFTTLAAHELHKKGVRINVVSPGVAQTNLLRNLNMTEPLESATFTRFKEMTPTQALLDPAEIASLICWTCNDELPNVSGSNFVIDSGGAFI